MLTCMSSLLGLSVCVLAFAPVSRSAKVLYVPVCLCVCICIVYDGDINRTLLIESRCASNNG